MDLNELLAKGSQRAPQAIGRHSFFNQLFYRAQPNQVTKIVKAVSLFFLGRNEAQTVPVVQLLHGQPQDALDVLRAESISRTHCGISRLLSYLSSFAQRAQAGLRELEASCPRALVPSKAGLLPRSELASGRDSF